MNENIFREKYRPLLDEEKEFMSQVKSKAAELYDLLNSRPDCREISVSKTKLEECVMWFVKGLTK